MTVPDRGPRRSQTGAPDVLREMRRLVRHGPDRVLHRWRRWRAVARARRIGLPGTIVFVCHGNICRSPYAAAVFGAYLGSGALEVVRVRSAGFIGPGRPSPEPALAVASARGVDLAAHRSRLVTTNDVREADLIVAMNRRQQRALRREHNGRRDRIVILGDLDPRPITTREIRDPVNRPSDVFAGSYDRIDRCVRVLADAVGVAPFDPHG